jgi:hypothetical protein
MLAMCLAVCSIGSRALIDSTDTGLWRVGALWSADDHDASEQPHPLRRSRACERAARDGLVGACSSNELIAGALGMNARIRLSEAIAVPCEQRVLSFRDARESPAWRVRPGGC